MRDKKWDLCSSQAFDLDDIPFGKKISKKWKMWAQVQDGQIWWLNVVFFGYNLHSNEYYIELAINYFKSTNQQNFNVKYC